MGEDARHMSRALELARKGEGFASPNPLVGSVVVRDGAVVGEGWHMGPGTSHAETMALAAAGEKARGATVYVTLEPCNHFGRTPPCVDAILASGAAEVVYALADPNPIAAGGAARLKTAGITVRSGVLEAEARHLNRFWLQGFVSDRPYVIAKFAMSLDGKIATASGESKWITSSLARERGHRLRQKVDAVIVGAGTVIADDPALTVRTPEVEPAHPLRVVIDTAGRTPPGAHVYDRVGKGALIATTAAASAERLNAYRALGVETLVLPATHDERVDLAELLRALKARGVLSVLVEGGAGAHGGFFDAGLVDEIQAFIAPVIIGGGGKSPVGGSGAMRLADALALEDVATEQIGPDILVTGRIRRKGAC